MTGFQVFRMRQTCRWHLWFLYASKSDPTSPHVHVALTDYFRAFFRVTFVSCTEKKSQILCLIQLQWISDVQDVTEVVFHRIFLLFQLIHPPGVKLESKVKIFPFKSLKCLEVNFKHFVLLLFSSCTKMCPPWIGMSYFIFL